MDGGRESERLVFKSCRRGEDDDLVIVKRGGKGMKMSRVGLGGRARRVIFLD